MVGEAEARHGHSPPAVLLGPGGAGQGAAAAGDHAASACPCQEGVPVMDMAGGVLEVSAATSA